MSHRLSVLQKATPADVRSEPFPHIILRDALPATLCDELIRSYPSLDVLGVDASQNNKRWTYKAAKVAANPEIPQLWQEFVAYHTSQEFFQEIITLFGGHIRSLYPERFRAQEEMMKMRVGTRGQHNLSEKDVLLDAQISGNTPVTQSSSVRTAHIDTGEKLFSGLFYIRRDEDDSTGGDLQTCRFKARYSSRADKLLCFKGEYVDKQHLEVVETVKYEKNVLVLFINSIDSIHEVTPRNPTRHTRIFLNLVGEVPGKLYEVQERWKLLPHMLKQKVLGLVGRDTSY